MTVVVVAYLVVLNSLYNVVKYKWGKWNESKLFAFNSKMLLQAMKKIQREMDKNQHGKRERHRWFTMGKK